MIRSSRRPVVLAVLAALVLTGCEAAEDGLPFGLDDEGTTSTAPPGDGGGTTAPADGGPDGGTGDPGGDGDGDGGGGDGGTTDGTTAGPTTPVADGGGVGANGRAMLRGDRPRLVIEIDVQQGASVDDAAVSHLVDEVSRYVDKPDGVAFAGGNTFTSDREAWTADQLRAAVQANRSTFSNDQQVSVHVLYVRGGHVQDGEQTTAIGLAYSASTIALFPDRWSGLGSLLGSGRAVERAVLVHELGHLFGLVNLTYTSPIDHEDPQRPGHSSNQASVMFHAIESTLVGQVFSGPPPDRFDEADAADLEGLRTGAL